MLYIRMIVMMIVSLYTSRVVLAVLGVEDYGIYNVVGGVVATFSLVTQALSSAITRYITFGIGKGNSVKLREIFSTSLNLQFYLSILVIILAETVGIWFLNKHLNIPEARMTAANWVLQFTIAIFVLRLLIVPYNSLIIAHEKMSFYAYFSIAEVVLQLLIVYLLKLSPVDKLSAYGFLSMIVVLIVFLSYFIYCKRNFRECCYSIKVRKETFKEMTGFAGWTFIGTSAGVLKGYGVDIIVNMFFGVTLNAARGIASQINTAVSKFVQSFTIALNPQITKSYAQDDLERMHFLIKTGTRFSFYLILFIALPLIFDMKLVLKIWLGNVPEWALQFSRLQLIESLIASLSSLLIYAVQATGKIKYYQIVVGCINLCNFPISLLLLYQGYPAIATYIVAIGIEILCLFVRLIFCKRLVLLKIKDYTKEVIHRVSIVTLISIIAPIVIVNVMDPGYKRLIINIIVTMPVTATTIYSIGLRSNERNYIKSFLKGSLGR
jgi:O-antigen/teichoic acid export membrane protein